MASDTRPLSGLRVVALENSYAGPSCTRYLAEFGAEVIRVESRRNPDQNRTLGSPWLPKDKYGLEVWMDSGPGLTEFSSGKMSIGVDLKTPEGMDVLARLLPLADVFLTNISAPAVASLKLNYEAVRSLKADIIYVAVTGFGLTPGPYYDFLALGTNQAALAGLDELTGWPDRPPSGIPFAYADYINGLYPLVAILAALDWRDRTGEGQCIDLSQFESTVALLGPHLLDYQTSGHSAGRMGNRLPWAAPQGVYPCRGNDRWVAISVSTDAEWLALCRVAQHAEWVEDSRFASASARLSNHDALDEAITGWSRQHTDTEIAEWLQTAGVAAMPVLDIPRLAIDPHLLARDFWLLADHTRYGKDLATGNPIRLQATPGYPDRAGPSLGQDNKAIVGDLCGLSSQDMQALVDKGAVFPMAAPNVKLERPYLQWVRHFMPDLPWPDPQSAM
ncbi:MAG: CoA transferase [Chloroflexi bacterium]|nr:CoA transferase [Chloroflexota bacterium]